MRAELRKLARLTGGTYHNEEGYYQQVELPDGVSVNLQHGQHALLWARSPSSLYASIGRRDHVATERAGRIHRRHVFLRPEDAAQAARLTTDPVLAEAVEALLGRGESMLITNSDIAVLGRLCDAEAEEERCAMLARLAKHVTETWPPAPPREPDIPAAYRRFGHLVIGDDVERVERMAAASDDELVDLVRTVVADFDALSAQADAEDSDIVWLLEAVTGAQYELGERGIPSPVDEDAG